MSFILVIVLRPDERDPAWAVFHTSAKVDDLKGIASAPSSSGGRAVQDRHTEWKTLPVSPRGNVHQSIAARRCADRVA